jgi:hypothetical protein
MTHDTQAGSPTTTSVQHAETDASTSGPHAASADTLQQQQLEQAQARQAVRDSEDAILRQQLARSQEQQEASQAEVDSLRAELADARQHIRSLEAELQDTMDAAMQLWDTIQVSTAQGRRRSVGGLGGGFGRAGGFLQDTMGAAMQQWDTIQVSTIASRRAGGGGGGGTADRQGQAVVESLRAELADARQHIRSQEAELQDTMDAAMQLWDTIQVSGPFLPQSFSLFLQSGGSCGGPDWGREGEKGEGCGSKGRAELADAGQHIRSLEAELQDTMDAAMQLWDTIQVSSFDPCRAATQGWHPGGGGGASTGATHMFKSCRVGGWGARRHGMCALILAWDHTTPAHIRTLAAELQDTMQVMAVQGCLYGGAADELYVWCWGGGDGRTP